MPFAARSTPAKPYFGVIRGDRNSPGKPKPPFLLWVLLLGAVAFVVINALSYDDVVEKDGDGRPVLTPGRKTEIAERQKKNEEYAEQYVLRAKKPGYRICSHCPEGKIWLEANEIAKIGVSTNGEKRYNFEFYSTHDVYYFMEYKGDLTTAKNREIWRLGNYPLLPENQKRRQKLIYPPLNTKLD